MDKSLHKSDIFKSLTSGQLEGIRKKGRNIKLKSQSMLFHQGEPAQSCFMVNCGRLKLTKLNEQGKEVIIRYIGTGELTAAIAVMKDWEYPVTAEAIEDSVVVGWDKPTMVDLMRQYPDIAINLLGIVLERIEEVQNRYLEVCTKHVDQRIARSLLRLMRRAGSKTPQGISITIPLSRQNIAEYSGTTLYTVSRTLSAWEKKGWIQSGRKQIIITDPHALVLFTETG